MFNAGNVGTRPWRMGHERFPSVFVALLIGFVRGFGHRSAFLAVPSARARYETDHCFLKTCLKAMIAPPKPMRPSKSDGQGVFCSSRSRSPAGTFAGR